MKKLFLYLLKRYTQTEAGREVIFKALNKEIRETYNEQTVFGTVHNASIEFFMSNDFICSLVKEKDENSLVIVKNNIASAYDRSLEFIKKEKH